jgi:hypothetical protein
MVIPINNGSQCADRKSNRPLSGPSGSPQPSATVPARVCLLCDGPASPPSRMGRLQTSDRQAVFCVCGKCSDCSDTELETKIVAQVSGSPRPPAVEEPTAPKAHIGLTPAAADRALPTWATRAAAKWAEPLTRPPAA